MLSKHLTQKVRAASTRMKWLFLWWATGKKCFRGIKQTPIAPYRPIVSSSMSFHESENSRPQILQEGLGLWVTVTCAWLTCIKRMFSFAGQNLLTYGQPPSKTKLQVSLILRLWEDKWQVHCSFVLAGSPCSFPRLSSYVATQEWAGAPEIRLAWQLKLQPFCLGYVWPEMLSFLECLYFKASSLEQASSVAISAVERSFQPGKNT